MGESAMVLKEFLSPVEYVWVVVTTTGLPAVNQNTSKSVLCALGCIKLINYFSCEKIHH